MSLVRVPGHKLLVVGLTGGIGSGKSTVTSMFAEHGAGIIDTDVISHHLTQANGAAMAAISADFGAHYISPDGALDRAKMRELIFSDDSAKARLEMILHPLILEQAKLQLQRLQRLHTRTYILLVVPLLPESAAFQQLVQRVLVVDCDEQIQISRVTARGRMTEAEVRSVITQQASRAARLKMADDIILNETNLEELSKQVVNLHQRYAANP